MLHSLNCTSGAFVWVDRAGGGSRAGGLLRLSSNVLITGLWSEVDTDGAEASEICLMAPCKCGIDRHRIRSVYDGIRCSL
mmetsp:Transcript_5003/g.16538  ORF Transcript_5003/g.16538 Transcript_5003/m.16538 type:complete len:80 (+) Transcript_5003:691-930(+)